MAATTVDVRRPRGDDRGFTLTEVLVAIALMGVSVVVIIGGIRAVIAAASTSDEQAKVEAVLVSASDRLRAADYVPCPDVDGDYAHLSAAAAATVGYAAEQVEIIDIQFWDASAGGVDSEGDTIDADGDWGPTNSFVTPSGCQSDINLTTSRTLQKVTIQVSSPDASIVRTVEVVKSPIVPDPDS